MTGQPQRTTAEQPPGQGNHQHLSQCRAPRPRPCQRGTRPQATSLSERDTPAGHVSIREGHAPRPHPCQRGTRPQATSPSERDTPAGHVVTQPHEVFERNGTNCMEKNSAQLT